MRVRVKLFASLRSPQANVGSGVPFDTELLPGATLIELVSCLRLDPGLVKVAFVNGRARPMEWVLQSGDEVGMFPPIGGG
jgi:molybdopterin synthase sulfur carrier subunit